MLAARYYGSKDIRIEDVPEPSIREGDDVLVEVSWCGICGTDLHEYTQGPIVIPTAPHPLTGARLPQILGHEFAGRVVDVGREVRSVSVGDRVAIMPAVVCWRCPSCREGLGHLCQYFACAGLSWHSGGLSRFAVLKDYQVAPLPENVTDVQGALVEPASVAAYAVERTEMRGGDIVLITGGGPIGLLAALYARARGAAVVVLAEPNSNRAAFARKVGVDVVENPSDDGFSAVIADLTSGRGVDVALECSGTSAGLATTLSNVKPRGTIVQAGLHTRTATIDAMQLSQKDVAYLGSWCYLLTSWPKMIRLIATGRYPVEKIVTSQIGLQEVVLRGFERLIDPKGDQVKVLVAP